MSSSVTPDDVAQYLDETFSTSRYDQCEAVITVVKAEVSAWTRGVGFDDDGYDPQLWAVILAATARRIRNPQGAIREEMRGLVVQHAPPGFTLTEQRVLNSFRDMAR